MENHMQNNHIDLEVPTIKPQTLECVLFFKVELTLMKNRLTSSGFLLFNRGIIFYTRL